MVPSRTALSSLHLVAVHVVARARLAGTGRFSLRVTPGGFGTPDLPPHCRRIRVSGPNLVVECDTPGAASVRMTPIGGSSLADLARFAGVDLTEPLDVGHDTPPLGRPNEVLDLDPEAATELTDWFEVVAALLDRVLTRLPASATPTLPRLWPEHFDVAIEAEAGPSRRVNLGGSPGDRFCPEPYLYVGPWTADRPGEAEFWNAPFGAFRTRTELEGDSPDLVEAGAAFLLAGFGRLQ